VPDQIDISKRVRYPRARKQKLPHGLFHGLTGIVAKDDWGVPWEVFKFLLQGGEIQSEVRVLADTPSSKL